MIFNKMSAGQVTETGESGWGALACWLGSTASGKRVTADSSMRSTAVYACIKLLSETVASLPITVIRKNKDGSKEVLHDHPLYGLLHNSPNQIQTSYEFRELQQGYVSLRGNAYAYKDYNAAGELVSLMPIHPDNVEPKLNENDQIVYLVKAPLANGGYREEVLTQNEIFHLRGFSVDMLKGLNPIAVHAETIGASLAAQDYGSRFFANDATPRGFFTHPTQFKDKEARKNFLRSFAKAAGGTNQHKNGVLESGITYSQTGMTNEDAQFLETRKYSVTDIARIFGVPPHMIGDLERATFSNIADQSIEFVVYTVRQLVIRWEQAIKRDLITEDDIYVEFNVDGLLRGDISSRYTAYGMGIRDGHLSRNEVRLLENRNPIDGLDEILTPMNMEDNSQREANDREADLENSAIARIVRKEDAVISKGACKDSAIKAFGNHAEFIKSVLAVDENTAQRVLSGLDDLFAKDILLTDFEVLRTTQIKEILGNANAL